MDSITLRMPDDFHVHFRRGAILKAVVPHTVRQFARALVMPNTDPPILKAEDVVGYRNEIMAAAANVGVGHDSFRPLMTIQITDETRPEMIRDAKDVGAIAGKVYPKGVTTNSANGVSDWKKLYPVFAAMQEADMVLSLHGQVPDAFILDREKQFLSVLTDLSETFPNLRIVMEHISTRASVRAVEELPNVAATITAHHLLYTLQDVLASSGRDGGVGLNPHLYCQPILQRPEDRQALLDAVMVCGPNNPKFFLGSDSAPHVRERKESSCGCAGVFSAPVLLPVLVRLFDQLGKLPKLGRFISVFGANFYHLPLNSGHLTLRKEEWTVPEVCCGIVPMKAGHKLEWKIE